MPIFTDMRGPSVPDQTKSARKPIIWAAISLVVIYHVVVFFFPRSIARPVGYMPLSLFAFVSAVVAWRTARRFAGKSRRAWRLAAFANISVAIGWACATAYLFWYDGDFPLDSTGDLFLNLAIVFIIVGLWQFVAERSPRESWLKTILDGSTVAVAFFLLCWLLVLSGTVKTQNIPGAESGTGKVFLVCFAILPIVMAASAFLAIIRDRVAGTTPRIAVSLLGLSAMCVVIAAMTYLWLLSNDLKKYEFYLTPVAADASLLTILAGYFAVNNKPGADQLVSLRTRSYASTFTVLGIILSTVPVIAIEGRKPDNIMVGFGSFMVCLVIIRQILLLHENVALNEDLERRVEKRTVELQEREERFRSLVSHSSDVITILDEEGIVRYVSPSVLRVFGYRPESWVGWRMSVHLETHDAELLHDAITHATANPGEPVTVEWSIRNRDGSLCKVESSVTALLHEPSVNGIVLNTRDVSERRALEQKLRHQASHDSLTGLANRNLFKSRMALILDRVKRSNESFALLFCDLDEFKAVNDSLGHAVGDEILVEVSKRLRNCVRPGDTVARLGGDEFAIVLEHIEGDQDAAWIAERIKAEVNQPYSVRDRDIFLGVSVGIASSSAEYDDLDDLLAKADIAMYMAKSRGKGNHVKFDPEMHEAILKQISLEEDLRQAIARDQLIVYYQPINSLGDSHVVGFEALVRWAHPEHGLIPPTDFIPLAEQTGLIVPIGRWVLEQAIMQLRDWQVQFESEKPLTMSINLSGRQLADPKLPEQVRSIIEDVGVNPRYVTLEMTESMLLSDADGIVEQLERLREIGVRLAIDDFGTGYSSLSYLRQFPVDVLKIDRAFVQGLGSEDQDLALVHAIMSLGEVMKLDTVAEGIENPAELQELVKMGCTLGQGFLFSRPAPAREITALLTDGISPTNEDEPVQNPS